MTHHRVILPQLVSLQVMALEHHDGPVEPGHVQAQVVRSDLLVGRVGENLTAGAQETRWDTNLLPDRFRM